jgi:DNA replication factor GINS
MNVSELQSVQATERQSDSLQELRPSFYRDAAEFVAELRDERARVAADATDPFEDPTVTKLSDDIRTAERTIEAIYDRRVGKVVKLASLAAADMPTDTEGLTAEEEALFETLVEAIESHREEILAAVTEEGPGEGTDPAGVLDAPNAPTADATGDGDAVREDRQGPTDGSGGERSAASTGRPVDPPAEEVAKEPPAQAGTGDGDEEEASERSAPAGADRTTVRITEDVGAILAVDEREYDLARDDVVDLPTENATPLIERDAAEPVE